MEVVMNYEYESFDDGTGRKPHVLIRGIESRWCWYHNNYQPLYEFDKSPFETWDGLKRICRPCCERIELIKKHGGMRIDD